MNQIIGYDYMSFLNGGEKLEGGPYTVRSYS